MAKNSSWPVNGLWSRGPLKDLKDSILNLNESKLFPWSTRISLLPFRTFRGPLFPKPVTGQELFFCCFFQQTGSNKFIHLIKCRTSRLKLSIYCFYTLKQSLAFSFFIWIRNLYLHSYLVPELCDGKNKSKLMSNFRVSIYGYFEPIWYTLPCCGGL